MGRLERLMYRHERGLYPGGRPNRMAAILNRLWAVVGSSGLGRGRVVTLDVPGRHSGLMRSVPLIVADVAGDRYLVAMLGEGADWVANVRAAGGRVVLRHGRREHVLLQEVVPRDRAPIVRRHLEVAPAARSFIATDRRASPDAFDAVARGVPVFRIVALPELPAKPPREGAA